MYFFFPLRFESLVPNDTTIKSGALALCFLTTFRYIAVVKHFW